jgi:hypothetical protein
MFGQLSAGYRDDVLAEGAGGLGALRAGDRVPDVDGLYDAPPSQSPNAGLIQVVGPIVDVARGWDGVVTVRAGVAPDPAAWLLVRPDGYLAAAGGRDDGAALQRWLDRWFVKPILVGGSN